MTQSDTGTAGGSSWSKLARYVERGWVRCLALIFFGAGIHIPSLTGELLWDDIPLINENPLIKSPALILEAFRHYLFPDAYSGHYRPLQTISYIFDYLFWNKAPYGYHLSSVLWHVLSGVVLYYLLCRILGIVSGSKARQLLFARTPPSIDRRIPSCAFLGRPSRAQCRSRLRFRTR